MPKSAQYIVSWSPERAAYLLTAPENGASRLLSEDGDDWLAWLEQHRAFAFHGRSGQINVLKERRRRGGDGYWYGYRRHGERMRKRYIGRSEQLSMERLEEIADLLVHEDETAAPSPAPVENVPPVESVKQAAGIMSFEPLLMPRLQLPRPQRSLLLRENLLELLDKGLEYKVTLIAGPAGFGKTTVVAQWIASRSERADFPRVASVTLDEGDNDPIRFWRYIIGACRQFLPGFGKEAEEMLLAHRLPPFKPLDMMLTVLLNALSRLEHSAILILDDLHVINSPQVVETFSFFLEHLPASLHLALLSRGDPPFSVARLRARNELLDIYPPHLAFSLEETRAFFERELPFTLSPTILRQIHERLEGWPAGLRLFARPLHLYANEQEIERMLATFSASYWTFQEYFLSEVLHALPQEQQEFLLQTSVLPRITAALCEAVTGREDSARLLEALRAGDLFLGPLDSIGQWMRYHTLFAEAMQQEARRRLGDERLQQLAARASTWYEEHGLLMEAIETALNASAFARAASLIERFVERYQQSNASSIPELYRLHRWLERLPEAELERRPDLCVQYAMTLLFILMERPYFTPGKERIYHLLQTAEQRWRDANNTAKLAEIFAFRALLARQDGKTLQSVTWARQALAWLPREDRNWRGVALATVGIGEIFEGSLDKAREYFLEALALNEQIGNIPYARAIRSMLAWATFEQGAMRHAAEEFRQIQEEARLQEDRDDIARTSLWQAQIAYQWNNLEEAEQAARDALAFGELMNGEELQALAMARLAQILHARGQSEQAQQQLTSWLAQRVVPASPHSYQFYRQVQAQLAYIQLASGDLAAVRRWFAAIERREEALPLLQRRREQLLWARLLLAQGESAAAVETLEGLHSAARETGHVIFAMEIQVMLAQAYERAGQHTKAREQLLALLERAASEGYLRLFLDEGEEMAEMLRGLLPHLREKALLAYVWQILSAFPSPATAPGSGAASGAALLLEPLSPQERKVLRLLAAGNSNAGIARELVVSVNTVRTQVQSIYRKLNVNNRVEASAAARQLNLI
jgi:LuxR family maltose regulon positive regulatory protein